MRLWKRARKAYNAIKPENYGARKIIENAFPELRESEDERIRKELIAILKASYNSGITLNNKKDLDGYLAYLEKQKDASKAIEAVDRIDKYIDEHVANAHDMKDSNPDKKYYRGWDDALGKMAGILQDVYSEAEQKEQTSDIILKAFENSKTDYSLEEREEASDYSEKVLPTSIACGESEEEYLLHKVIEAAYIAGQKEQKPVQLEEEKEYIRTLKSRVADFLRGKDKDEVDTTYYQRICDWLDGRHVEQKPVEWSEEDREMKLKILKYLSTRCSVNEFEEVENWLNNLRPSWKPSDEQMSALNYFIKLWGNSDDQLEYTKIFNNVKSLRDDLEKQM